MTPSELREWMEQRFDATDEKIDLLVTSINERCKLEHEAIDQLKKDVKHHDRQLWILRGMGFVLAGILSYFGIQFRD